MTEDTNTFTFDGVEYSFDDVSEKVKYIIGHLTDLKSEQSNVQRDLDRVNVTLQAFSDLLKTELEPETAEAAE